MLRGYSQRNAGARRMKGISGLLIKSVTLEFCCFGIECRLRASLCMVQGLRP